MPKGYLAILQATGKYPLTCCQPIGGKKELPATIGKNMLFPLFFSEALYS
jgi:hypothetical protein